MSYSLEIADRAKADLREIQAYIAKDSPVNADRWLTRIQATMISLTEFPEAHPLARENSTHEREIRQLTHGKYRIIYYVENDTVMVVSVRHSSRRPHPPGSLEQ